MGRVKVQLKKIENKTYRHIAFAKRKSGLVKKAYELSTLCDVEVCLVIFSPAGKLILFEAKNRLEEIVKRFADLPEQQRGWLHNKELILRIISQMTLEVNIYHRYLAMTGQISTESQLEDITNETHVLHSQLEFIEKQIRFYVRSPSCIQTTSEGDYYERILEEKLIRLRLRKNALEASEFANQPVENLAGSSSSYFLNNVAGSSGSVPQFSAQPEPPRGNFLPLSSPLLHGDKFPFSHVVDNYDACVPQSDQLRLFDATFPAPCVPQSDQLRLFDATLPSLPINIAQKESETTETVPSNACELAVNGGGPRLHQDFDDFFTF